MKISKYHFQWFEKEDRRKSLRASVSKDGKLRLGKSLREKLPPYIQIGFDPKFKILAIADGHGAGIDRPHCGVLTAQTLSSQIASTGLHLPISFLLVRDECTGYFLGRVLPRRRKAEDSAHREYDADQLLILYQHVIDNAVNQLSKSTPIAERKAYALEAFYEAVRSYRPGYGDFEAYLEEQVQNKLISENRQYTAAFGQRSLDQPLSGDEDGGFCLYDTVSASTSGGIDQLEERIMAEQFLDSLSGKEQKLSRMLWDGYSLAQISEELDMTEAELVAMGKEIGQKRRQFYAVA